MSLEFIFFLTLLCVGFVLILKSADYFIDESAVIGKYYGMSKLLIGLTIVAIGTSLPELLTSLGAVLFTENYSEFIIGTIMGSNITNIFLIFGLFMLMSGNFEIRKNEKLNIIMLLFTTIFLVAFVLLGIVNYFSIILVILYLVYLIYLAKFEKREILEEEEVVIENEKISIGRASIILFVSFIGLFLGAKIVIMSIESIGEMLLIPAAYLTLTTVSFATSLPEIAVTITAARKKQYLLAIGNIIGSNIANIALVFGLSGFIGYYAVQTELFLKSIIFLLIATFIFSALIYKKKFNKVYGHLFLGLYVLYIISFFF